MTMTNSDLMRLNMYARVKKIKHRLELSLFQWCKAFVFMLPLCFCIIINGFPKIAGAEILAENGLLSLSVQEEPLDDVLQEIASQTGMKFEMRIDIDRAVTIQFEALPMVEGLRRILNPDSFVIEYGDEISPGVEEIKKVIVYGNSNSPRRNIAAAPKGKQRVVVGNNVMNETRVQPPAEDVPENTLESYGSLLKDPDPELREEAISDMVDDYGVASLPYLEKALLSDGNDDVRIAAAGLIGGLEEKKGIASLIKGLSDQDEDVRLAVVEAIGEIGGPEIMPALEKASNDSNEEIRDAAKYLIEELKEN